METSTQWLCIIALGILGGTLITLVLRRKYGERR